MEIGFVLMINSIYEIITNHESLINIIAMSSFLGGILLIEDDSTKLKDVVLAMMIFFGFLILCLSLVINGIEKGF